MTQKSKAANETNSVCRAKIQTTLYRFRNSSSGKVFLKPWASDMSFRETFLQRKENSNNCGANVKVIGFNIKALA